MVNLFFELIGAVKLRNKARRQERGGWAGRQVCELVPRFQIMGETLCKPTFFKLTLYFEVEPNSHKRPSRQNLPPLGSLRASILNIANSLIVFVFEHFPTINRNSIFSNNFHQTTNTPYWRRVSNQNSHRPPHSTIYCTISNYDSPLHSKHHRKFIPRPLQHRIRFLYCCLQ